MNTLEFCAKYLKNVDYTINPDDTIDVNGDVDLWNKLGDKLPVKFGKVSGEFFCCENKLTTLEGCPNYISGSFYCFGNKLTTLEGCPKYVGSYFNCHSNKLTTLEGCPKYVGSDFYCEILTHHILGNIHGSRMYVLEQRIVI